MRHGISGRKLNRKSSHRTALLKNLSKSMILNEQIETTLPKAKDLRPFVEKILTFGKKQSLHSKRKVYSILRDDNLVKKVFEVLAKRYSQRNGGYVRVLKSRFRYGDSSPMAVVELVDRDIDAKGFLDKERLKESKKEEKNLETPTEKTAKGIDQKKEIQQNEKSIEKKDSKEEKK